MRAPYEIGIVRIFGPVHHADAFRPPRQRPSEPAITPLRMPNNRNATAIDRTVSTVRIGLRQSRPEQRYFI